MSYRIYADGVFIANSNADTAEAALDAGCKYAQSIHPHRVMVICVFEPGAESGLVRRVFPPEGSEKP